MNMEEYTLYRVDMGFRTKVKRPQFFIEYVVARSPRQALACVLERREDMEELSLELWAALPPTFWQDIQQGPVIGDGDVRGGLRMDVEPYCVEHGCRGDGAGALGCHGRFGDSPGECAASVYVLSATRYVSILRIAIPGYELVPVDAT